MNMARLHCIFVLACTFFVYQSEGAKTYRDMFPHKHSPSVKFPPIPGWHPDSNPWDEDLYPPFGPKDHPFGPKGLESGANDIPFIPKDIPFIPKDLPYGPPKDLPYGPKDLKSGPKDLQSGSNNLQAAPKDIPFIPKDIPFIPKDLPYGPFGPKDLQAGPKALKSGPKDLKSGPKDLKSGPKDLKPGPKDIPFIPKDIPFIPKDLPYGPFGPKDLQAGSNNLQAAPKDIPFIPKDIPFIPKDLPYGPYGPKDLQAGPKGLQSGSNNLQAGAKDIPFIPKDIPFIPKDLPYGPFGPKGLQSGSNNLQAGANNLQAGAKDIPFIPKDIPFIPKDLPFGPEDLPFPFGPKPPKPVGPKDDPYRANDLNRRKGKPTVRLTSDSPAINGSMVSFTAKLEFPKCQKEDANGDLVWDEHCEDANGQVKTGYVYNWTAWLDDYGFGKCTDWKSCNVFPDGVPFPQSNDWGRKGYVYVWHSMGQYYETCDGSSSSLSVNTTGLNVGAEMMEVMVYRKRERRKYSPLATDNSVFYVTDKIPVTVNISQKAASNLTKNVFVRGEEVVFSVKLHDPSAYLKSAAAVDYIWDFKDGNQLVTHSDVATHAYTTPGDINVKLTVEAAFRIECPAAAPTPMSPETTPLTTAAPTPPPGTHAITSKMETTQGPVTSMPPVPGTTGYPTTEPLPPTVGVVTPGFDPTPFPPVIPSDLALVRYARLRGGECFRYLYGNFQSDITIVDAKHSVNSQPTSRIIDVSSAKVTNTDISFLVKCLGSAPTSACTIVSDPTCRQVRNIVCDDVPPSSGCEVRLRRTFHEPGTYCVNITLEDATSLALASTTVTIGKPDTPAAPKSPHTAEVVLSSSAVLVAIFAFIAFMVYKRYKVYRPVRRSLVEDASYHSGVGGRIGKLRSTLFPTNEESRHLLTERRTV